MAGLDGLRESEGYYFGCIDVPGHYIFVPRGRLHSYSRLVSWILRMDGALTPFLDAEDGKALLHHFDGFTVLAFNDCSVDTRPQSNSMFVFPGNLSFEEIIVMAVKHFPGVMGRFNFVVKLADA